MSILISKERALQKLNDRLYEAERLTYAQCQGWKSRTVADVRDIFNVFDHRYSEINHIFFPTQFVESYFTKAKNDAIGYLRGYIQYISENIPNTVVRTVNPIEQENFQLTKENVALRKQSFDAAQQLQITQNQLNFAVDGSHHMEDRIKQLEENIFQTEDINALRLWKLFINLPGKLQIGLITFLIAIFCAGIYVGRFLEKIEKPTVEPTKKINSPRYRPAPSAGQPTAQYLRPNSYNPIILHQSRPGLTVS